MGFFSKLKSMVTPSSSSSDSNNSRSHGLSIRTIEERNESAKTLLFLDKTVRLHPPEKYESNSRLVGVHKVTEPLYTYKATRQGIAKLKIPEGEKIVVPNDRTYMNFRVRKLRCSGARVESLFTTPTNRGAYKNDVRHTSINDITFKYEDGEFVRPDKEFNNSIKTECGSGIHFFLSREKALEWHKAYGNR